MKIENSIGWCDETTNGVTGCDKVSPGCKNCYAAVGTRARVLRAQGIETWGPKGVRHPVNFEPVFRRLNKLCICNKCHEAQPIAELGTRSAELGAENGETSRLRSEATARQAARREPRPTGRCACGGQLRRIRLFADSNSDWLDEKWPVETLAWFLDAIRLVPNVDVLLLTKRPENWEKRLRSVFDAHGGKYGDELAQWLHQWIAVGTPPANVWLGVSVENQAMADERVSQLLKIPAAVRFLSCEPLLEAVDLGNIMLPDDGSESPALESLDVLNGERTRTQDERTRLTKYEKVDWVIVGGESGADRRHDSPDFSILRGIISVAEQCRQAGVPCYVKQDGAFKSGQQGRIPDEIWRLKQFPIRKAGMQEVKP